MEPRLADFQSLSKTVEINPEVERLGRGRVAKTSLIKIKMNKQKHKT